MVDKKIDNVRADSAPMRSMGKSSVMRPFQRDIEAIMASNKKANTPNKQPSAPANHSQEPSKTKPDRR